MTGGGILAISARRIAEEEEIPQIQGRGAHVLITIKDTGVGMDEETLERAFEPFFTNKPGGEGSGLGLAVVYGIVTSHGGRVWVSSEVGKGTSVYVALPVVESVPQGDTPSRMTLPPDAVELARAVGRDTILVVDDEAMVRKSIRRMLEKIGFHVRDAGDGVEGLAQYEKHSNRIALVVLDLIMPIMDGEQTLQELRKMDSSVKVVIVSGYHDDAKANSLRAAGALGFLTKPFDIEQLQALVTTALMIH